MGSKILQNLIYPLTLALVAVAVWFLKPADVEQLPGRVDSLYMPVDSSVIVKEALVGMEVGTREELVKKYGKIIRKTLTRDSLNIIDSLRITDSTVFHISTLSASDTFSYSGFDLLNEDTAKVNLQVRTDAIALLEPVNAIQIKTVVDSLVITVPPKPDPTLLELAVEYWEWLTGIFFIGYVLGG